MEDLRKLHLCEPPAPAPPPPRRRWIWLALSAALLGALGATAYLVLRDEPVFTLGRITLRGATRLSADEAAALAGLTRGMNMLAIKESRVQASLEALPFVRQARVEVELPATIRLRIDERRPAAIVALGHLYVADTQGVIFRRLRPGEAPRWPVITGFTRRDVRHRADRVAARLREALGLAHAVRGRCLEEISYHPVRGFSLLLCDGPEVRLGSPPFTRKLTRLPRALERGAHARIIYLDDEQHPDRLVVRNAREGG